MTTDHDIRRYCELRAELTRLKREQAAIAERLRALGDYRSDTGAVKQQTRVSRSYDPLEALKALNDASYQHGRKAAEIALLVSSRGIQDALDYLTPRISADELEALLRRLEACSTVSTSSALSVHLVE